MILLFLCATETVLKTSVMQAIEMSQQPTTNTLYSPVFLYMDPIVQKLDANYIQWVNSYNPQTISIATKSLDELKILLCHFSTLRTLIEGRNKLFVIKQEMANEQELYELAVQYQWFKKIENILTETTKELMHPRYAGEQISEIDPNSLFANMRFTIQEIELYIYRRNVYLRFNTIWQEAHKITETANYLSEKQKAEKENARKKAEQEREKIVRERFAREARETMQAAEKRESFSRAIACCAMENVTEAKECFSKMGISQEVLNAFYDRFYTHLKSHTRLDMRNTMTRPNAKVFFQHILPHFKDLEYLDLEGGKSNDDVVWWGIKDEDELKELVKQLPSLTKLETLDLRNNRLTSSEKDLILTAYRSHASLKTVHVMDTN